MLYIKENLREKLPAIYRAVILPLFGLGQSLNLSHIELRGTEVSNETKTTKLVLFFINIIKKSKQTY